MRIPATLLTALLLSPAGCLFEGEGSSEAASELGEDGDGESGDGESGDRCEGDRDDGKVEDADIGVQGVSLDLGSRVVSFESWIPKEDSPGEYVGFTLSLSSGDTIGYAVKTGGEVHAATGLSWSHPNGTTGPEVPGISNVDFCDDDDGGDGGGDDGGGDDGGGDDGGGDDGGDTGDDDGGDTGDDDGGDTGDDDGDGVD